MANNAQVWRKESHLSYEPTAREELQQFTEVVGESGVRVLINGGALFPSTCSGVSRIGAYLLLKGKPLPKVSAHAYFGARGISTTSDTRRVLQFVTILEMLVPRSRQSGSGTHS
jgi:hypothetical protein